MHHLVSALGSAKPPWPTLGVNLPLPHLEASSGGWPCSVSWTLSSAFALAQPQVSLQEDFLNPQAQGRCSPP